VRSGQRAGSAGGVRRCEGGAAAGSKPTLAGRKRRFQATDTCCTPRPSLANQPTHQVLLADESLSPSITLPASLPPNSNEYQ
jgi:hypothetical protein